MKFIITLFCLLSSLSIFAQKNRSILEIDHFGYIYTSDGNELKKYSPNKNLISNFSDALLGEIASVDVSNPLRILLFYKEFNQILYLDQNLNPLTDPIDLYTYSDNQIELCCNSTSANFWLYDKENNQIFEVSRNNEILNKSGLLSAYTQNTEFSKMIEMHENIYLLLPNQGILIVNKFGQFSQQIPLLGISDFCFNKQQLLYLKDKKWFEYEPLSKFDSKLFEMNTSGNCRSKIQNDKIYILCKDKISIKKLTI